MRKITSLLVVAIAAITAFVVRVHNKVIDIHRASVRAYIRRLNAESALALSGISVARKTAEAIIVEAIEHSHVVAVTNGKAEYAALVELAKLPPKR